MNTIANLYQLHRHIGIAAGVDDIRLTLALEAATGEIERQAGRRFVPVYAVRDLPINPRYPGELLLNDDLLELTTLTDNGAVISAAELTLLPGDGASIAAIDRANGGAFTGPTVAVAGWWGWHPNRADAWVPSGDTIENDPLTATATTLLVTNADATDPVSGEPRFQAGQVLRIGDELLRVLAVAGLDDQLTVVRGVAGTTATSHLQGASIDRYNPPAEVVNLCLRWAAWLYRLPDQAEAALPVDLRSAVVALRRTRVT